MPLFEPLPGFTVTPELPNFGQIVTVDASDSVDPDGQIVRYDWTFGDGTSATGVTASHVYDIQGAFLIRLTVTDNDGLTARAEAQVLVGPIPCEAASEPACGGFCTVPGAECVSLLGGCGCVAPF